MKIIRYIFILIVTMALITITNAYAQGSVHDNTSQNSRTGTGTFSAKSIKPLEIMVVPNMPQGESFTMVENQTFYFTNEHYHYTFKIRGEDNHPIAFEATLTPDDQAVYLTPVWYKGPDANENSWEIFTTSINNVLLSSTGKYFVRCELESATAGPGTGGQTYTFTAKVTAWYIDSL